MTSSASYLEDGRARAKVNLTLHVGRAIESGPRKGYHPVGSLVVFAGVADRVKYCKSYKGFKLDIQGGFKAGLAADDDNLIIRAARDVFTYIDKAPSGEFILEKNLPVASGIGGGSADAAAALRLILREHKTIAGAVKTSDIMKIAEALGADVPVCYYSQTCYMRGIGQEIEPVPDLGRIPALLVNPGFGVSTAEIFKAFDSQPRPEMPAKPLKSGSLLKRTQAGRNDLQNVAIKLRPEIGEVIDRIAELPGCSLSRMSGSGATCFGLFTSFEQALEARDIMLKRSPHYWCVPTLLGDVSWSA